MLSLLDSGGGGTLAVDFNLGLKPQRFVFRGPSWGAVAGLGCGGRHSRNVAGLLLHSQAVLPPPWLALKYWGPGGKASVSPKVLLEILERSRSSQGEQISERGSKPSASGIYHGQFAHMRCGEVLPRHPERGECLPLSRLSVLHWKSRQDYS